MVLYIWKVKMSEEVVYTSHTNRKLWGNLMGVGDSVDAPTQVLYKLGWHPFLQQLWGLFANGNSQLNLSQDNWPCQRESPNPNSMPPTPWVALQQMTAKKASRFFSMWNHLCGSSCSSGIKPKLVSSWEYRLASIFFPCSSLLPFYPIVLSVLC